MSAGASADAGSFGRTAVYLVRHGQTLLNESGVLRGLADRRPLRLKAKYPFARLKSIAAPVMLARVVGRSGAFC
jgi:hypothetical protein